MFIERSEPVQFCAIDLLDTDGPHRSGPSQPKAADQYCILFFAMEHTARRTKQRPVFKMDF